MFEPVKYPVAVVTGAGSGVGRHASIALAGAGFLVVLAGRRIRPLEETARLIRSDVNSPEPRAQVTDVTAPDSVKALFQMVEDECGRIDLLFNNAGISAPDVSMEELDDDAWLACISTNLTGAFFCTREAFRMMKNQYPMGGRIINNGSVSAQVPRADSAPYTASKHGITGLTKSTALDGRKYNIACGQIDIGNARTDMAEKMGHGVTQANGSTAVEPTIDIDHVARAVVYMATLPLEANVLQMTVMANQMPFVGRG